MWVDLGILGLYSAALEPRGPELGWKQGFNK